MINSKFNVGDEVFVKATVAEVSENRAGIKYMLDIRETGVPLRHMPSRIYYKDYDDPEDAPYNRGLVLTVCIKENDIFQSPSEVGDGQIDIRTTPAHVNYTEFHYDQDDLK